MRKSGFYPHLAMTNILRNGQFYLPYFLTCTATIAMFYILCFLSNNDMIDTLPGAPDIRFIMYLGCIVVGLFSLVIISYTNSFIMKRRHRELGLYNILGMEKRHIARLLCCESILLGTGSILCGLALGILLSKLILLLLLKLVHGKDGLYDQRHRYRCHRTTLCSYFHSDSAAKPLPHPPLQTRGATTQHRRW